MKQSSPFFRGAVVLWIALGVAAGAWAQADLNAVFAKARADFKKGDFAAAATGFEQVARAATPEQRPVVLRELIPALQKCNAPDRLEAALTGLIGCGTTAEAAKAYLARGDLRMARSELEPAAFDYLRIVVLFKDQAALQPEALFKAADVLEKMRDSRAKDLYKELVEKYPGDPLAAKAKGKI